MDSSAGKCEHDWRVGPFTDPLLRFVPVVCVKCFDLSKVAWETSRDWPRWTEELATIHSEQIEKRYG